MRNVVWYILSGMKSGKIYIAGRSLPRAWPGRIYTTRGVLSGASSGRVCLGQFTLLGEVCLWCGLGEFSGAPTCRRS